MHLIVEIEPHQLRHLRRLTSNEPIPVALSETGAAASFALGPAVLDQLTDQLALDPAHTPAWDDLDMQTKTELVMLTNDSAPWAMDQRLHDTAGEDLSEHALAQLRPSTQGVSA